MAIFQELTEVSIHFSKMIGIKLVNNNGNLVGKLTDFFVDYAETYPIVLGVQYKRNNQLFYVEWEGIKRFSFKKIIISDDAVIRRSRTYAKIVSHKKYVTNLLASQYSGEIVEYPPLGRVVLDRQIVDTYGKKVVRVNDIQFIKAGQFLRVTHAAIGFRSLIRRLGYEPFFNFVVKIFRPNSKMPNKAVLINWKYVHAIPDRSVHENVKLSLVDKDIKSLHPADLADILEDLDVHAREYIFSDLTPKLAARTLSEVDPDMQASFIRNENPEDAAKIIENMGTDEAVDILNDLEDEKARAIISNIEDDEVQEEIHELLEYEEDTAGGLMTTEVFEVFPDEKRSGIISRIQEEHDEIDSIYDVYVVNSEQKLIGTCSLAKILIQKENVEIEDIMNENDIKSLPAHTTWRELASYMSKYNLINVPIVDLHTNELLGIVSVEDILPWLLNER